MSSKPQRSASRETEATSTPDTISNVQRENLTRDEEIRFRAYEIFLARGEQEGNDLDDWLQAEREIERGLFQREPAG
jgi:hypothetical protein